MALSNIEIMRCIRKKLKGVCKIAAKAKKRMVLVLVTQPRNRRACDKPDDETPTHAVGTISGNYSMGPKNIRYDPARDRQVSVLSFLIDEDENKDEHDGLQVETSVLAYLNDANTAYCTLKRDEKAILSLSDSFSSLLPTRTPSVYSLVVNKSFYYSDTQTKENGSELEYAFSILECDPTAMSGTTAVEI